MSLQPQECRERIARNAHTKCEIEPLEPRLLFAAAPYVSFRALTGADQAQSTFGVTGKHVCVAILDRGIDYTVPDFRNADGTTRIKWMLDMSGTGNPVEYSAAQINAALSSGTPLGERDAVGHGTVTAGIAAGNGSAAAAGEFAGMAPDADLIIVKLTSEGAPAHDNQPAEAPFQANIDQALDWLDQKITLIGEPCVALINSGTQWGPIDGTSAVSRKIDQVFGNDRPGRVYVSASGDEGNLANHAGGDFTNATPVAVRFSLATADADYGQLWYTGSQPAQVTFRFDDGTVVGPVTAGNFTDTSGVNVIQYQPGQEFYPWTSTSGDRAVWFNITGHQGGGTILIQGQQPGAGHFNLYGDANGDMTFADHLVPGRLTDYAATQSAIVAGASVLLTDYTDVDGFARTVSDPVPGNLWPGSSAGPTRDGRDYGVDVVAPGENAFAAYAPNSYWGTFRFNLIQGGNGLYGRGGATSGAAPIVVGAVALMLQEDPSLTANDVRQIFRQTATSDAFTGSTPNLQWGYGKLNVFGAIQAVAGKISATVFNDGNYNGIRDASEPGLANAVVFLDLNHDGAFDAGDVSTTTDGQGNYTFADLAPGTYAVGQVAPAGYRRTTPVTATTSVVVRRGKAAPGPSFGDVRASSILLDFSYLLLLAQHYGQTGTIAQGDLDDDGRIGFSDLLVLAQKYNRYLAAIA